MLVCFHSGGMVAVFPECSLAFLSSIECLGCAAGDELLRSRNCLALSAVEHEQMDVVGCDGVVGYAHTVAVPGFEQPAHPFSSVHGKLENEVLLVAALSYVPGISGEEVLSGSGYSEVPSLLSIIHFIFAILFFLCQ